MVHYSVQQNHCHFLIEAHGKGALANGMKSLGARLARTANRVFGRAGAVLRGRYFPFARKYRVPGFSTVMLKATELGTLARVRELGHQADLLLKPQVRHFGMTEVKSFDAIVQAGYEHAMAELPEWMESRRGDR